MGSECRPYTGTIKPYHVPCNISGSNDPCAVKDKVCRGNICTEIFSYNVTTNDVLCNNVGAGDPACQKDKFVCLNKKECVKAPVDYGGGGTACKGLDDTITCAKDFPYICEAGKCIENTNGKNPSTDNVLTCKDPADSRPCQPKAYCIFGSKICGEFEPGTPAAGRPACDPSKIGEEDKYCTRHICQVEKCISVEWDNTLIKDSRTCYEEGAKGDNE
jgi:hypothetical protein